MPEKKEGMFTLRTLKMALTKKLPGREYSPQGKLYKELGKEKLLKVYINARRGKKFSKRLDALVEKTRHDKGLARTYTSGPLTAMEWHKKEGRSVSQNSLRSFRSYKRNFGGK